MIVSIFEFSIVNTLIYQIYQNVLIDALIKKSFWQINSCNSNYSWSDEWNAKWFVFVVYYVDDRYKIVFNEKIHSHFDDDVNLKKNFEFDCTELNRRDI